MSDTLPPCDHDECSLIACSKDEIEKLVVTLQNNGFGWIAEDQCRSLVRLVRKELHTEVDRLRATLRFFVVGSCNCPTKTPEVKYHAPDCVYRQIKELLGEH